MSDDKEVVRAPDTGKFLAGKSGNKGGRPKGSKNKITILKQSLELALRQQSEDAMHEVMDKALELAKEGDKGMIKLLLELHMSKGTTDDAKVSEKVAISINTSEPPTMKDVIEVNTDERQADK